MSRIPVRARLAVAAAAWAVMLACVPHPSPDPTCEGSTVTGTRGGVFVTPSGEVPRPFQKVTVNALLPRPGGHGYVVCPGNDDGSGRISIASVPDGKYYLQEGTNYYQTAARDVDLTDFFIGRADGVTARQATPVSLQGSGMESWLAANDVLTAYSWGARAEQFGLEQISGASGVPSDGATQLSFGFDWSRLFAQHLLDASKGDTLIVDQMASRKITGGTALMAVKQMIISGTTLRDGQSATLSGTFADLTPAHSFSLSWSRSKMDALAADTAPEANSASQDFFIVALPEGTQHGQFDLALDMLATGFSTAGSTDVAIGGQIPNPPTGFGLVVEMKESFAVTRSVRGATTTLTGFVYVEDSLDRVNGTSVDPRTGPVTKPKINGADAIMPQSGVGLTPVVSWTAPSMAPDVVRVLVERLTTTGGTVGLELVAVIFTGDTSVQIPDGVLSQGETYVLFIESLTSAGASFDRAPLHFGLPNTEIRVVTQTFTP